MRLCHTGLALIPAALPSVEMRVRALSASPAALKRARGEEGEVFCKSKHEHGLPVV